MHPRDNRSGLARLAAESTALLEIGSVLALQRKLRRLVPRGDGHPVMLIPGFTATDRAMGNLRRFLNDCGYAACGWDQGRNLGVSQACLEAATLRLGQLAGDSGRRVSVIGWSGGGMYARALGHLLPGQVRQVITMGTPFKLDEGSLDHLSEGIYRLHERLNARRADQGQEMNTDSWREPPPVPSTSLFSKRDAMAPWPFCLDFPDGHSENIQVPGSHAGMTYNPLMYYVIADRLAQPQDNWRPFEIGLLRRWFFRHGSAQRRWYADPVELNR